MATRWARIGSLATALALASVPTVAHAAPPPPSAVSRDAAPISDAAPDRALAARRGLIAGLSLLGAGALMSIVGFSVLGGMHAANPGPGLEFDNQSPARADRMVRTARTMEALGYSGVALMLTGGIIAAVSGAKLRQARRLTLSPGIASLSLSGRF